MTFNGFANSPTSSIFSLLASNAFPKDNFTYEQVFGETHQEPFSAVEATEYLEVSLPTLRNYMQSGGLLPSNTAGRNQLFFAQMQGLQA
ncbi:DNA-binding protein [Ferrovum sp. PN-J185]|uniref:DNA-binding protein n=1 Tax=Ferrovum sp. PN-J185 TaxID=1356306 RepID=UPI001E650328|nr:DNA-binding protein [Ferrovum sp. PN-J185]MCC6068962.1 DNA-binding protein [Ferrovum sp. PN-J185]MDE1891058.1 DNA-binding protein [Betaproteobacteria bacterium]MDE2055630.1 DNA-binding protein [Betaproteobacteria bacterium]